MIIVWVNVRWWYAEIVTNKTVKGRTNSQLKWLKLLEHFIQKLLTNLYLPSNRFKTKSINIIFNQYNRFTPLCNCVYTFKLVYIFFALFNLSLSIPFEIILFSNYIHLKINQHLAPDCMKCRNIKVKKNIYKNKSPPV